MSFDDFPDCIVRVDNHGLIREMNTAAANFTGYAPKRQVGRPCDDVLHPRSASGRPLLTNGWGNFSRLRGAKRLTEQTVVIRCADGEDRPVRLTGSIRRDHRGRFAEAVLSMRPIRSRGLGGSEASGIAVVSTVSHELRSPLTAVKGYTSLLLNRWDKFEDDDKKMMLGQISHGCERVTRLITELLEVSRLEGGRLPLQRQLVELPDLVARVVQAVKAEYPDLDIAVNFAPITPRIFLDPDKIEQVITNLVENACKYASPIGIQISGTIEGEFMKVVVEDIGEGIPQPELSRIFSKFYRGVNTKPSGSGLGLWISKGIIETHGGDLTAESTTGVGSRFTFTLPLEAQE